MLSCYIRRSVLFHKSCKPFCNPFINNVNASVLYHNDKLMLGFTGILYTRNIFNKAKYVQTSTPETDQFEDLKQVIENPNQNWSEVKSSLLSSNRRLNSKNVDAIILKFMVNHKKLETALSFAGYLEKNQISTLGSTNALLRLYYEIGKEKKLHDKEKGFILDSYKKLYDKYQILDYATSERLLHALCIIDEWEKALKILDEIHHSGVPSHSAYSTLIATFFRLNNKTEALKLIQSSLSNKRQLQYVAYVEWINYILRKSNSKKTVLKHLDGICLHISKNSATLDVATAEKIAEIYTSLGWSAKFSKISRHNGQCETCKETLQCLKLTQEEFIELQKNVKQKLIVGSDLFLKTSPEELDRFLTFIQKTAPYDIVLDALNIALAAGTPDNIQRITLLKAVVDQFKKENKKILLLGRKHMLKWPRQTLDYLRRSTCYFFTEDLSQDDPYFITAAILSGANTDIVSKDLLRGHRFQLKDENLGHLFRRWQWQHQWMVFARRGRPQIMAPLKFTPFAQKIKDGWHLPYEKEDSKSENANQLNTGLPDLTSWLCLKPKSVVNK